MACTPKSASDSQYLEPVAHDLAGAAFIAATSDTRTTK